MQQVTSYICVDFIVLCTVVFAFFMVFVYYISIAIDSAMSIAFEEKFDRFHIDEKLSDRFPRHLHLRIGDSSNLSFESYLERT